MIYKCELLYERGAEIPIWQTAFGKGYLGMLRIGQDADPRGLKSFTASFEPLPFVDVSASWPRPLRNVQLCNELDDCRYIEGVEPLVTIKGTRWLRRVWRLTQLSASELAEIEAQISALRPHNPDSR